MSDLDANTGDHARSVDVRDGTTDIGSAANPLVDPPGLLLAVIDVIEAVAPDLQLAVGVALIDLYCANPLCVIVGVLPARFCVNADLRVKAQPPRSSVARADGPMGAGRRGRRENRRYGECDRGHSSTDDGPYSAPPVARCHLTLPSAVVHNLRLSQKCSTHVENG